MNREILFRAKCKVDGKWVEGYVIKNYGVCLIMTPAPRSIVYSIDPNTICQYTGETDKHRQRIYEGDILEAHLDDLFPGDVTRVCVVFENMKWCLVQKGRIPDPFETGEGKYWEVIGNVFDNPELIGDERWQK